MAVKSTQLYDKSKQKIYPLSDASAINCDAATKGSTVHKDIADLYEQISKITGDQEAANNIIITIHYKASKSKIQSDIVADTQWSPSYMSPTPDFPYTWKRTVISYKGDDNSKRIYEIVASMDAEITQTIYRAVSAGETADIDYFNPVTGKNDPDKYNDGSIPDKWSTVPVGITAAAPNAYMATRTKKEGKWESFSTPVQFGRWAYDSKLELRYQVTHTSTAPEINEQGRLADPGEQWKTTNSEIFTGFLWMISAMSVGNELQSYDGIIWNGPNLLSIVK